MFALPGKDILALSKRRRTAVNLTLALAITFCLFLLNTLALYSQDIYLFFDGISRFRITGILVHLVFFVVAGTLVLAFMRWRRVEQQRSHLETILSAISPDAVVVADSDRNILSCSATVQNLFGYSKDELVGQKTHLLYRDQGPAKESPPEVRDALEQHQFCIGAGTGRHKNGTFIPLEIVSAELSRRGGSVLLLRNIAGRARTQVEFARAEEQMRLSQKLQSLGVLAGGIAHDFNNLLAGILGNAELACDTAETNPQQKKSLREIIAASRQAAVLCKEILACAGKGNWRVQSLDLSAVVKSAAHILRVGVAQRQTLEYELEESLPAVEGDSTRLQQMICNLTRNASEAIGDNEGRIVVSTGVLQCDAAYMEATAFEEKPAAGTYVFVRVSDTGGGLDSDTLPRIFEPFFTTKYEHRGLGLASVCGIVQSHNGTMRVENRPGQGTSFTVLFPAGGRAAAAARADAPGSAEAEWKGQGTILLVEDDAAIRRVVETALRRAGLKVLSAANAEEGFELFTAHVVRIDAVLLDINLPHMGGAALWASMKDVRPDIRAIVTSGDHPDNAPWLKEVSGFVQKPFSIPILLKAVRTALEG